MDDQDLYWFSDDDYYPEEPPDHSGCPGELVARRNSYTGNYFIGCSRFPTCRYTREAWTPLDSALIRALGNKIQQAEQAKELAAKMAEIKRRKDDPLYGAFCAGYELGREDGDRIAYPPMGPGGGRITGMEHGYQWFVDEHKKRSQ